MGWFGAGTGALIGSIFGPIGTAIGAGIGHMIENEEKETQNNNLLPKLNPFKIKIFEDTITFEDSTKEEAFVVSISGDVKAPYQGFNANLFIGIHDITESEKDFLLIFTEYEGYSFYNDSFFYLKDNIELPYEFTSFNDYRYPIYKSALIFPYSGRRKLLFFVALKDNNDKILDINSVIYYYNNPNEGYEEYFAKIPLIEELTIQMAFCMCGIDGEIGKEEANVIKKYVKELLENKYQNNKDDKERLNSYISKAYNEAINKTINIPKLTNKINEICDEDTKLAIFDICLNVAAADGVIAKEEFYLVNHLAKNLKLDKNEAKKMIDKKLPITMYEEGIADTHYETILGITPDLSKDEIKKILNKEFQKWNRVVGHSDAKKREQAEQTLQQIIELRKKYL